MADERELKEQIVGVMKVLHSKGLVTALTGSVSARPPGADYFWMTPKGVSWMTISPDDLVKVNVKPSSQRDELQGDQLLHAAVYRAREDVNAVVHAHNPLTLGAVLADIPLRMVTVEALEVVGKLEVVPYAKDGSRELCEFVARFAADKEVKALILRHHGVIGMGKTLYEALAVVEALENLAKAVVTCFLARGKVPELVLTLLDKIVSEEG